MHHHLDRDMKHLDHDRGLCCHDELMMIRPQNQPKQNSNIRHSFLKENHFQIICFMIFFTVSCNNKLN